LERPTENISTPLFFLKLYKNLKPEYNDTVKAPRLLCPVDISQLVNTNHSLSLYKNISTYSTPLTDTTHERSSKCK